MMQLEGIILAVIGTVTTTISLLFGLKSKAAENRAASELALQQMRQKEHEAQGASADGFRATILTELKRAQDRTDALNDKYNHLALDHATLAGQVQVLQNTRDSLISENQRLLAELLLLKNKNIVLDDENQLQGDRLLALSAQLITNQKGSG